MKLRSRSQSQAVNEETANPDAPNEPDVQTCVNCGHPVNQRVDPSESSARDGLRVIVTPDDELETDESDSVEEPTAETEPRRSFANRVYKASRFWVIIAALIAAIVLTGLSASVVKTGSMRPTYQPGDLVVTVNSDLVKPKVGSVVVATPWVSGAELPPIAHRVVAVNDDGTIKTKGDYNPEVDAWTDRPEDVDKTVIAHVPMGWIMTAMKSPFIIFGGLSLLALMLFWPSSKKEDETSEVSEDKPVESKQTRDKQAADK